MKCLQLLLFLCFLYSCADKPKPAGPPRPTLVPKDSLLQNDSANAFAPLDRSPMDMSYYPVDYTIEKMSGKAGMPPVARVLYSRPHRQGRQIFGSLIKYREPWRLGANEATEIEFFRPVTIQGKTIPRGRYILYAIPQENQWTVVFNTNLFTWGLKPNASFDVYHFDVPVQSTPVPVEYFSMVFQKAGTGAELVIAWDAVMVRLPFQF